MSKYGTGDNCDRCGGLLWDGNCTGCHPESTPGDLLRRCNDMETVIKASVDVIAESLQALMACAVIYPQFLEGVRRSHSARRLMAPDVLKAAATSSQALKLIADKAQVALAGIIRVGEEVKARRIADGLKGEDW